MIVTVSVWGNIQIVLASHHTRSEIRALLHDFSTCNIVAQTLLITVLLAASLPVFLYFNPHLPIPDGSEPSEFPYFCSKSLIFAD